MILTVSYRSCDYIQILNGEMAERFKAQSWKDYLSERVTRVQIPISPFTIF